MKNYLIKMAIFAFVWNVTGPVFAVSKKEVSEYLTCFDKIQELPAGAKKIRFKHVEDVEKVIARMKQDGVAPFSKIKFTEEWASVDGDEIDMYEGDFTNDGSKEYLFLTAGGKLSTNSVAAVYKEVEGHFQKVDFDKAVINSLLAGKSMAQFYRWVARPFAYRLNDKTYLRFMDFSGDHRDYNKKKLLVCTYLWEGDKISLVNSSAGCIG